MSEQANVDELIEGFDGLDEIIDEALPIYEKMKAASAAKYATDSNERIELREYAMKKAAFGRAIEKIKQKEQIETLSEKIEAIKKAGAPEGLVGTLRLMVEAIQDMADE